MTRFDRRELRNYVREAEAALRTGFEKLAARDRRQQEPDADGSGISPPDFRVLRTLANSGSTDRVDEVAD